jgi:hypothetical protein
LFGLEIFQKSSKRWRKSKENQRDIVVFLKTENSNILILEGVTYISREQTLVQSFLQISFSDSTEF